MTNAFLQHLLSALSTSSFPNLGRVYLAGFGAIERNWSRLNADDLARTHAMIEECPFVDVSFLRNVCVDRREASKGYRDGGQLDEVYNLEEVLLKS